MRKLLSFENFKKEGGKYPTYTTYSASNQWSDPAKWDEVDEYKKFEEFDGALRFGDWSEFAAKLKKVTDKGFTTIDELLEGLGLDKAMYDKVKRNMIYNWIDSVSKSLLHGISGVDLEIPEKGDVIFNGPLAQTRFIIVGGPGAATRNLLGDTNSTQGLGLWGYPSIVDAKSMKTVGRSMMEVPLSLDPKKQDVLDELLQYIWTYVFYNDYLKKAKNAKLPKALYRGIRVANMYQNPAIKDELSKIKQDETGDFRWEKATRDRTQVVIDHILKHGLSDLADGNYLSFTGSLSVAEYFTRSEGIILKIDPKKVRVVTSPLTDEEFAEPNPVTGKKEQEYIVMLPDDYKFEKDDIIIASEDYLVGDNNPLAVAYFGHDDKKAEYDYTDDEGKKFHIEAWYSWTSNTSGKLTYKIDGNWQDGIKQIKRDYGFDPTPTEKNLDRISNFQIKPKKSF